MNVLIKAKDLGKHYSNQENNIFALDGINFELNQGESMAIVGPSGSGKSTLLNLLGGLDKPSKGELWVADKNLTALSDNQLSQYRNKQIGFVFQFFYLIDYLTVLDNVLLPQKIFSGTRDIDYAKELLDMVGLSDKINQYPGRLSGGEMQRASIARALANKPNILLADEPTGNLDRDNADKVMKVFETIAANGVSIIIITHDNELAQRFPKIIKLSHGKLLT